MRSVGAIGHSAAVNLPNALTLGRLLLVPLVVALLAAHPEGSLVVAGVFLVTAATDSLDGYLARARGSVTTLGTVMDPLVDKLLVLSAMFTLVAVGRLELWVVIVVLAREAAVSGLRLVASRGGTIIRTGGFGKLKMAAQVATVAVLAAVADAGAAWVDVLVYGTAAVTVASGLDYLRGYRRSTSRATRGPSPVPSRPPMADRAVH